MRFGPCGTHAADVDGGAPVVVVVDAGDDPHAATRISSVRTTDEAYQRADVLRGEKRVDADGAIDRERGPVRLGDDRVEDGFVLAVVPAEPRGEIGRDFAAAELRELLERTRGGRWAQARERGG